MKKIILLLTLALLILSNNISYSQDALLSVSLLELSKTLNDNDKEIKATRKDFVAMIGVTDSQTQKQILLQLISTLDQYHLILLYQRYLLVMYPIVNKNQRNLYYALLKESLSNSKKYTDWLYKAFEGFYLYLEMTSALHSVDKVKKNMLDTLAKIDSTSELLSKETKSKP